MPTSRNEADTGSGKGTRRSLGMIEPVVQTSVVVATAKALRDEILARAPDDMFLGSEGELMQRLGVSQPTFRQAARLLEYEELLTVRRGVGGGYFGRLPSAGAVARMAAIYLLAQGTSFADVMRTQFMLESEILRSICESPDASVRERFVAHIRTSGALQAPTDVRGAVRAINALWRLAGELAGNRSMTLFTLAAQTYGGIAAGFTLTLARYAIHVADFETLADLVAAGDAEGAMACRRRTGALMLGWAEEDAQNPLGIRAGRRGER